MSKTKMIYGAYGYIIGPEDKINVLTKCCCNSNDASGTTDEEKKKVTMLFDRQELLYDISNVAYVEGDVMPDEALDAKKQTLDITEDGNVDRVTRVLDLAHAMCVEYLYPFSKTDVEDGLELDDIFKEEPIYTISLSVPKKFSTTTANLLEKLIHEFMVDSALGDWLSITNPKAAEKWQASAQGLLEEVKRKINSRTGILTRPLRPF